MAGLAGHGKGVDEVADKVIKRNGSSKIPSGQKELGKDKGTKSKSLNPNAKAFNFHKIRLGNFVVPRI